MIMLRTTFLDEFIRPEKKEQFNNLKKKRKKKINDETTDQSS